MRAFLFPTRESNEHFSASNNSGGLFGGQQSTTAPSIFGNTTQPAQNTGGIFGNTQVNQGQNAPNTGPPSIFGATKPLTGGLGTSSLGFGAPQPSTSSAPTQATQSGEASISGSTKFNDLPEQLKKILENLE